MKTDQYFAKSRSSCGIQKTVKEHLCDVAQKAGEYGEVFGRKKEAALCGQLHDFGKYSDAFQRVLNGTAHNIDHAVCGAALLYSGIGKENPEAYEPVIEAIHAHHTRLENYEEIKAVCKESLKNEYPIEANDGKTAALAGEAEYREALKRFLSDFPDWQIPRLKPFRSDVPEHAEKTMSRHLLNLQKMLYTRMLFSCLVDADYTVSAADDNPDYPEQSEKTEFEPERMLKKLYRYHESIRTSSGANAGVNQLRDELFEQCGKMGEQPEGLYTLTAPTGTGKTLALFHFALRHCAAAGKRRIIIVLPFLTLTEQNAEIYRQIVPELLEDHSQKNLEDAERQFASRWSVPVILTTSVRFFETLFSARPTDCRKLHQIANSVVVFDEAQTLPAELLTASLQAVNELCRSYHTTMVFSTATQPDFDALASVKWRPREIMPGHERLYRQLKRTRVTWRIDGGRRTPLDVIAKEMKEQTSVCAIVNLRSHARKLYALLKEQCGEEGLFFLTTDLCPAHRKELAAEITRRLQNGLPCRVAATQCIEAGVDFDFDAVYRALAPLESVIQAAGRCNRNGRMPNCGSVIVFIPDEEEPIYPGNWYETAAHVVENLHHKHAIDIHDPQQIREYYHALFQEAKDKKALTDAILHCSFADTDREYQLISNQGVRVIVPYQGMPELYHEIRMQAETHGLTPGLIRKAAPITVTVGISRKDILEEIAQPLSFHHRGERRKSLFYVLNRQFETCYTDDMGLQLPEQMEFQAFW